MMLGNKSSLGRGVYILIRNMLCKKCATNVHTTRRSSVKYRHGYKSSLTRLYFSDNLNILKNNQNERGKRKSCSLTIGLKTFERFFNITYFSGCNSLKCKHGTDYKIRKVLNLSVFSTVTMTNHKLGMLW